MLSGEPSPNSEPRVNTNFSIDQGKPRVHVEGRMLPDSPFNHSIETGRRQVPDDVVKAALHKIVVVDESHIFRGEE